MYEHVNKSDQFVFTEILRNGPLIEKKTFIRSSLIIILAFRILYKVFVLENMCYSYYIILHVSKKVL